MYFWTLHHTNVLQYNPTRLCIKAMQKLIIANFRSKISPCLSKDFREFVECLNELSALLADGTTTRHCIPE